MEKYQLYKQIIEFVDYDGIDEKTKNNNKNALEQLITAFRNKKITSFIGAGASNALGIPTWEKLLQNLSNKAKEYGFDNQFDVNYEDFPEYAESLHKYFEEKNIVEKYNEEFIMNLQNKINTTSLTLVKLILAIENHITTNFDNSIEYAYEFVNFYSNYHNPEVSSKKCTVNYLDDKMISNFNKDTIIYLHGNIKTKIFIFKKSDYDLFYPSVSKNKDGLYWIENFLKEIYRTWNIVFVGFSFKDYYLKKFFFEVKNSIIKEHMIYSDHYSTTNQVTNVGKTLPKHFWLIDNSSELEYNDELFKKYEEKNILPIIYKEEQHVFLEKLFEYLCMEKNEIDGKAVL